jgi:[ribosomal protein S5]-alanine N-acetyltransferase
VPITDDPLATAVEPATLEHVDALLAGDDVFAERFGLAVVPGYLEFPEALPATREGLLGGLPPEWYAYQIIDRTAGELIGWGGFKGPPVDHVVEVGYSLAPARRGRGHATAAVRQFVALANAAGCRLVCAHTLAAENPSTRVLTRAGFAKVADVDDPDDGPLWRWELPLAR